MLCMQTVLGSQRSLQAAALQQYDVGLGQTVVV